MSNLGQNVYMDVQPSNVVSTGKVSYKEGNPVIQFIIGENDLHLMGSSVRFCGNIAVYRDSARTIQTEASGNLLCLDPKLGIYSIIDTLTLSSQVHKSTIERVNNYNRFMSSYMPILSSEMESLGYLNATTLVSPNIGTQRIEVCNNTNGSGAVLHTEGSAFAVNLPCGLLGGRNPIPLSRNNGIGGLMIEIQLAPDSQVFFSDDESATGLTDAFYELSNLKLIAEAQVVAPNTSVGNTFEYNSIHSYFNSVNSTNAVLNFNLGLSNVLGTFINIVPSKYINNFAHDGLGTTPMLNSDDSVADIKQIVFTRGGIRMPLMYDIETQFKNDVDNFDGDPQQLKNFVNAITPYYALKHTQLSPHTFTNDVPQIPHFAKGAGIMYGLGVAMDQISGQGVNFSNVNFGVQIENNLTTDSPNALYLFVRNRSTLVFTENGVQIMN